MTPQRALVAMSGGVDSAVAALLTARAGEEVVCVTLELWADAENDGERSCCSAQAVRGARALAHARGLPHLSIDLREEFRAGVVEGWLEGYAQGITPNPCIRCNGSVRLDAMLELATRLGAARLITGHYARFAPAFIPLLRVAADPLKDQSYALAALDPRSLARMGFPLGELTKAEVREIAEREGLSVAHKPDSQDLCFLAGTSLPRFLERHGANGSATDGRCRRAERRSGRRRGERRRGGEHPRPRRPPARLPPRRARFHCRPAPRPRPARRARAAVRAAHRPARQHRHGRPPRGADDPHDLRSRRDAAPARRAGRRRACPLARAAHSLPLAFDPGPGRHEGVEVQLQEPITRAGARADGLPLRREM